MNKNPIYCAIDTSSIENATVLVEQIAPHIGGIKVGLEFFTSCGMNGIEKLAKFDLPMFIDLKLHDIPNTVKNSLKNILAFEPKYTTLHISGGSEMLKECINLKNENNSYTNLIGVTVLTSFNENSISEIGISSSLSDCVQNLSNLAFNCGLDGIVCSPLEIKKIKEKFSNNLKLVVPGIRDSLNDHNDQKRTLSAKEAIDSGADIIVIGRPITQANSPADAARIFHQSIK